MTERKRVLLPLLLAFATVGLIAAAVYFGMQLLDDTKRLAAADQWSSVVAAVIAVLCLPLTIYGLVLARRSPAPTDPETGTGPVRQHVQAGRDAYIAGRDQHFGNRPSAR